MMLQSYRPSTADVLLWYPKKFREYLICWALRSKYHHASLLSVNSKSSEVYVLDQNVDFVREDPVPLDGLLKYGYKFDVYRLQIPLSEYGRNEVKRTFNMLRQLHYPYLRSLRVPFNLSFLPKGVYPEKFVVYTQQGIPRLDIMFCTPFESKIPRKDKKCVQYKQNYCWYESFDKITCSGAVVLAFCVSVINCFIPDRNSFDPEVPIRHPILFLPEDFATSPIFKKVGTIDSNTQLIFTS